MPRVVASTLAGETQSFAAASGLAEWVSLMLWGQLVGVLTFGKLVFTSVKSP